MALSRDLVESSRKEISHRGVARRSRDMRKSCQQIPHRGLARRSRGIRRSCIEIFHSHRGLAKRSCRELRQKHLS